MYGLLTKILSMPLQADMLGTQIGDKAQEFVDNPTNGVSGAPTDTISSVVSQLVNLAIPVAVFACIMLMAYAGYTMITSQGNPEKLTEAKEIVTNALTGFALIILSVVILVLIDNVLGLGIS